MSYHTEIVSPVCEAYYYDLLCISHPNLNLNIIIDNWNILKPKTPITETNIGVNMYYSSSKSFFPALLCNTSYIIATYSDLPTFTHFLLDSHICPHPKWTITNYTCSPVISRRVLLLIGYIRLLLDRAMAQMFPNFHQLHICFH